MKKSLIINVLSFIGILLFATNAFSAQYFVASTGGNDSYSQSQNDINHPWSTIRHSMSQLSAGDTLYIRAGSYSSIENIHFTNSGTQDKPITIAGYPGDARPTIIGNISGTAIYDYTFWLDGCSFFNIQGIDFKEVRFFIGYEPNGGSSSQTDYLSINDCKIINTKDSFYESRGSLIIGNTNYLSITNSEITSGGGHNVLLWERADYLKIENCYIHGGHHGIYCKHGSSIGHHTYKNNIIKDVGGYYSIAVNANNTTVENNLIYQTTEYSNRGGIQIHNNSWPSDYATINHNTIYGCTFSGIRLYEEDGEYPSGTIVTNNLIVNSGSSERRGLSTEDKSYLATSDYNLVYLSSYPNIFGVIYYSTYSLLNWRVEKGSGFDTNSINAAPTFTNGSGTMTTSSDFVLAPGNGYRASADGSDIGADISLVGLVGDSYQQNPDQGSYLPDTPFIESFEISTPEEIAKSASVIFYDDFETQQDLSVNYHDRDSGTNGMDITNNDSFSGTYSLEQKYSSGQVEAGYISRFIGDNPHLNSPGTKYDEIYFRFYHKFQNGFSELPQKMSRLKIFQTSNDWTGYLGIHQWINENYLSADTHIYTTDSWLPMTQSSLDYSSNLNIGRWICIEVRVKLNTIGQNDGEIQYWADGEEILHQTGLNLRSNWDEKGLNTIMLDCYWNGGSPKEQSRFYDNFIISTSPIGIASSPVNPVIYKSSFDSLNENDFQSAYQAQISISSSTIGMVWSGAVQGNIDSIKVDTVNGVFQGDLNGKASLDKGTIYYARVRQANASGTFSNWSSWYKMKTANGDNSIGSLDNVKGLRIVD